VCVCARARAYTHVSVSVNVCVCMRVHDKGGRTSRIVCHTITSPFAHTVFGQLDALCVDGCV
jgi:hypothetical protein